MIRVCFHGAESTGKSVLARRLEARFGWPWVPEYGREYAEAHPHYGWQTNMGYGTAEHLAALREHGPSPLHRRQHLTRRRPANVIPAGHRAFRLQHLKHVRTRQRRERLNLGQRKLGQIHALRLRRLDRPGHGFVGIAERQTLLD